MNQEQPTIERTAEEKRFVKDVDTIGALALKLSDNDTERAQYLLEETAIGVRQGTWELETEDEWRKRHRTRVRRLLVVVLIFVAVWFAVKLWIF